MTGGTPVLLLEVAPPSRRWFTPASRRWFGPVARAIRTATTVTPARRTA